MTFNANAAHNTNAWTTMRKSYNPTLMDQRQTYSDSFVNVERIDDTLKFKKPIEIKYVKKNKDFELEFVKNLLGIIASGKTKEELVKDFWTTTRRSYNPTLMDQRQTYSDSFIHVGQIDDKLKFTSPIKIKYVKKNKHFELEFAKNLLGIIATGETKEELVKDFKEELRGAWDYYAFEEDKNLTNRAKKIKVWLREHIVEA